jgi:phenylacetate-CoA ligase
MTVPNAGIRSITRKSSGTTGEPIRFRQPYKLTYDYAYAALYQAYSWHGVLPLARRATLAGRYLGRRDDGIIIRNYSENQLLLGVHSLGPDTVGTYMSALRRFKPALLQAHPSAMLLLRELSLAQGIAPVDLPAISFTGETLFEKDRKDLMSWCSGVVFGQYGSGEHHLAAAECAMLDGYHMNPDFSYTEVLQTSLGGQIVSTSLLNDVMPLIRYQIGDLAEGIEEKPCMCGRTWPRLIGLRGRADDVLTAADGRMLAPVVFRTGLAARFSDLPPYTLIQHREKGAYTLQVFTHRPTETFSEVGGYLTRLLGPDAKVDILRVCPSNQLTMRGKHKMVVRE